MDDMDFDPSDLGFDPYAGTYLDDDFEDYLIGGDSDLTDEW